MQHPDKPLDRPMTVRQQELLASIVATNGGGISALRCDIGTLNGLVRRHFVQGKKGNPGRVVHTELGLAAIRKETDAKGGEHG
jgi:uncharacterized protein YjhX (UPF0386 family)